MTLSAIDNPRPLHLDVEITSSLGLAWVKPISARCREWFRKHYGSEDGQLIPNAETFLINTFKRLGFVIWFNPPDDSKEYREMMQRIHEDLENWKRETGWVSRRRRNG